MVKVTRVLQILAPGCLPDDGRLWARTGRGQCGRRSDVILPHRRRLNSALQPRAVSLSSVLRRTAPRSEQLQRRWPGRAGGRRGWGAWDASRPAAEFRQALATAGPARSRGLAGTRPGPAQPTAANGARPAAATACHTLLTAVMHARPDKNGTERCSESFRGSH